VGSVRGHVDSFVVCLMIVELSISNFQLPLPNSNLQCEPSNFQLELPTAYLQLANFILRQSLRFSVFHSLCLTLFNFKYQIAPQYHLLDDLTIGCPPATSNFQPPPSHFQLPALCEQLPTSSFNCQLRIPN
jgi:hypothetical protein